MSLRKEKLTEKSGHTKVNGKVRAKEIKQEQIENGERRKPHPDKTKREKWLKNKREGREAERNAIAAQSLETISLEQEPKPCTDAEINLIYHDEKITSECAKAWLGDGKQD